MASSAVLTNTRDCRSDDLSIGRWWRFAERCGYAISILAVVVAAFVVLFFRSSGNWQWNLLSLVSFSVTAFGAAVAVTIYRLQIAKAQVDSKAQREILVSIRASSSEAELNSADAARSARAADETAKDVRLFLEMANAERKQVTPSAELTRQAKDMVRSDRALGPCQALWVDDHLHYITWERQALRAAGVPSTWVPDTSTALQVLVGNRFDLVISDMAREGGANEGLRLLDSMRAAGDTTPFIIYSTDDSPESRVEIREHGGQGVAAFPEDLFEQVMRVLNRPSFES